MKVKVYDEYGALNSPEVFEAFKKGVIACGDTLCDSYEEADAVAIWSVLFKGRMQPNEAIWNRAQKDGKPVVVLEVGNLKRNESWRVGINGINNTAVWGEGEIDPKRKEKFGIELQPWNLKEGGYITICTQRGDSLQWKDKQPIDEWVLDTIKEIKKHTNRLIVIRPHPRQQESFNNLFAKLQLEEVYYDVPQTTGKDQVNFDDVLRYSYAVVNYSAGPGIQSVIAGVPVITSSESLASPVSINIEEIETPQLPDREKWFDELVHTEWCVDEIEAGIPWQRLKRSLNSV